jgi:hypothetical protein
MLAIFVAVGGALAGIVPAGSASPSDPVAAGLSLPPPVPCPDCWVSPVRIRWQWVLSAPDNDLDDYGTKAPLVDVDMFTTPAATVEALHRQGRVAFCYIDAGSWEKDRPDAARFPKSVLGNAYQGYPDERWLDIRRIDILGPIMTARIAECNDKGFDGAQFDNLDGYYIANTGFPLTAADQRKYDVFLANAAHRQNLGAALENDIRQGTVMARYFDWAIFETDRTDNYTCFYDTGCALFAPFVRARKAVMVVDYAGVRSFCRLANERGFNGIRKHEELGPWTRYCR